MSDRPGDRDQQQAERFLLRGRWTQQDWHDARDAIATALAAARAEEAARWQATAKVLADFVEAVSCGDEHALFEAYRDARAVLDES